MKKEQKNKLFGKFICKLLKTAKAFSLVEILVVVLIIGVLSAVALPKYRKSMRVARAAEIGPNLKALEQAINVYIEERGFQAGQFLGSGKTKKLSLDLGLPACKNESTSVCSSKYKYQASCQSTRCEVRIQNREKNIVITASRANNSSRWQKACSPDNDEVCRYLKATKVISNTTLFSFGSSY